MENRESIIENFSDHKPGLAPLLILVNEEGNIYDISQLRGDGREKKVSTIIGIEFSAEEIKGEKGDYPVNIVEYLKNSKLVIMSESARRIIIGYIEKLVQQGVEFEIHPGDKRDTFLTINGTDIHLHIKGFRSLLNGNYAILIAPQTGVVRHKIKSERMALIGGYLSGLLHDLVNNINLIKGLSEHIMTTGPKEVQSLAKAIYESGEKIEQMRSSVLHFLKTGDMNIVTQDLASLVSRYYVHSVQYDSKKEVVLGEMVNGLLIDVDELYLNRVFNNLVDNATHAGASRVEIKVFSSGGYGVMTVTDNGCGIPGDKIDGIFDPLYTTSENGTGLGLSNCIEIVKKHNGFIDVESELATETSSGKTTFSVLLPLSKGGR